MTNAVFYVFAVLTALGLMGYFFQLAAVRSMVAQRNRRERHALNPTPSCLPPISIIKPLKGLDDNLFDNLSSFCVQAYPRYEIIFALQDMNDPAYKIVRKVTERRPDCDITILVERCSSGLNPKVNNLIPACSRAKYEHILISDSNVLVGRDYLSETARHMHDPHVGLVTNIIRGARGRTMGSLMENLHLNSFIIGSVCFLDRYLHMPCVIGKSMLMRKTDLAAIGGFNAVKDVLAEDYVIGKMIHEKGKRVVLSDYAVSNVNEYWSFRKFLNRHTRWGKLRWKIGGIRYLSELVGNGVFMSCLPLVLAGVSTLTATFAIAVSTIKVLGDMYLGRKTGANMNPFAYLLSPLKDVIIGCIWFVPLVSDTVLWRGNRYIIGRNSSLSPYPEDGVWAWRYRIMDVIRTRLA
ncbi:MAG: ceramide glucosyltransferase [Nitrospiraceae bacterium]|nr:ceramide glucosyltransferase [Nitrospiraceae bacterium]